MKSEVKHEATVIFLCSDCLYLDGHAVPGLVTKAGGVFGLCIRHIGIRVTKIHEEK